MLKYLFPFFIGVYLLFACSTEPKHKVEPPKKKVCEFCVDSSDFIEISKDDKNELKPKIEEYYNQVFGMKGFSGGFLVAKNGQIIFEKYSGFRSKKNNFEMKSTTPVHLASISKVLTATAVFRLIEGKQLELDQKVKTILPEFPYNDISVRMLLNHRSGIAKYAYFSEPDSIWGVEKTLHNQDVLDILSKYGIPLDFVPDTKFVYNNSNYAILALIVEKITKLTFPDAMKLLVFEPLGMMNSFVFIYEKDKYRASQSYNSKWVNQGYTNLDAIYGDKNIYSTPRDLLKFDLAMQKNDFVSAKLKKEIYKGYSYEKPGVKNYGLGIRLKEWETGERIFYHNGWWHGNTTSYVTMKEEGVTIIALSNKYTRKVYDVVRLSIFFGDYPFGFEEEEDVSEHDSTIVPSLSNVEKDTLTM